jgi:type III secretory pathway component EscR
VGRKFHESLNISLDDVWNINEESYHWGEQKIIKAVKEAFKDEEFMKRYLNNISEGDDHLEEIVDDHLKKLVEDYQLDWENFQKMLKDPAVRQKAMEELHKDPGKVDQLLESQEVRKVLKAAYKAGYEDGVEAVRDVASSTYSSGVKSLIVLVGLILSTFVIEHYIMLKGQQEMEEEMQNMEEKMQEMTERMQQMEQELRRYQQMQRR